MRQNYIWGFWFAGWSNINKCFSTLSGCCVSLSSLQSCQSSVSNLLLFLFHLLVENSAENERHLCEVSGSRLSCSSLSETENRRSSPGCERRQPGRDGLQHVSIKEQTVWCLRSAAECLQLSLFSFQWSRTDPIIGRLSQTAGGKDRH